MSEQPQPDPLVRELRGLVRTDAPVPTGGARVAVRTGRGRAVRRVVGGAGLVAALLVGVPVGLSVGSPTAAPVPVATQEPSMPTLPSAAPAVPTPSAPVPTSAASPGPAPAVPTTALDPASGDPDPSPAAPGSGTVDPGTASVEPVVPDPAPGSTLDLPPTAAPALLEQEGTGGSLSLVEARVSVQDGFDRVVWEYAGDGTPGWYVQYVDDFTQEWSGDPVELAGDANLELNLNGVRNQPDQDGVYTYQGPGRLVPSDTGSVREVSVELTWEGSQQSLVGVREELPFRVTLLRNPTRVVLDVAHEAP